MIKNMLNLLNIIIEDLMKLLLMKKIKPMNKKEIKNKNKLVYGL